LTLVTRQQRQQAKLSIKLNRNIPPQTLHPFKDYFKGFEKVEAVRKVFGNKTDSVLQNLKVGFVSNRRMYMGIRDEDGNISVGTYHLKHSDLIILYLDIVHELFHVKQFMENRKYFRKEHMKFMRDRSLYYASPIEIPAYKHTVREAERLGMTYEEIVEYLKMGPTPPMVFNKFIEEMELKKNNNKEEEKKMNENAKNTKNVHPPNRKELPVRINRSAQVTLYPFLDYFKGFENHPSIKSLFGGEKTDQVLRNLKVEFVHFPFRSIFPSEEDGHLQVSRTYFKSGDINSIYLDVFLSLNLIKRLFEGNHKQQPLNLRERGLSENPVMIESYKAMVDEARQMGMKDAKILDHFLQLPRFMMSQESYNKFVQKLGLSETS
jgi:hypothetical protein